ncbi:MAG: hypothetical protein LBL69_00565 [Zoogloeaceae bacterium]|nr:hypothetical protein [Zoogloeaceae bacterium]
MESMKSVSTQRHNGAKGAQKTLGRAKPLHLCAEVFKPNVMHAMALG